MTATCREACCSATPRLTVTELFERGFRRNRTAPLSIEGARCTDAEGHAAAFSLDIADGKIAAASFRASSCTTLIAYCEYIVQAVAGVRAELAGALTSAALVSAVSGVPPIKRQRAVLALAAFRSALAASGRLEMKGEYRDESCLHLRHPAP